MACTLVPHHSHFGAFSAVIEDNRLVGAESFGLDPDPSPLIDAIPEAVYSPTRIVQPMVRQGWLDGRGASGTGGVRGRSRRTGVYCRWGPPLYRSRRVRPMKTYSAGYPAARRAGAKRARA